jgi:hypothetical protein
VHQAVLVGMMLSSFFGMLGSVERVAMGDMGVVAGLFVIARFVMIGRFPMMFRSVFVVLRRFLMMICRFVSHGGGSPYVADKLNNSQQSTSAI